MDYTHDQIKWAVTGVSLLPIVALAAIASFAAKSRLAFLVGSAGALLGLIIPEPVVYAQYSSGEAAYIAIFTDMADHLLFWGIIGASAFWWVSFCLKWLVAKKRRNQDVRSVVKAGAGI